MLPLKRSDLLRHLRNHGCELIREGEDIHGGEILAKIVAHPYLVTLKLMKT
jgi:hypothetical protein